MNRLLHSLYAPLPSRRSRLCQGITATLMLGLLLACTSPRDVASTQPAPADSASANSAPAPVAPATAASAPAPEAPAARHVLNDPALDDAIQQYDEGRYEAAIDALSAIAQDTSMDIPVRREALQYLGRAHLARNEMEGVRQALHNLLELEPPLVELNPDVEPPSLMRLYYEVRKDFTGSYEMERESTSLQTLAIMDFSNASLDERERFAPLQLSLPDLLRFQVDGTTDLKVVERERIQWILDELELQRDSDIVDQATAVQTGRVLGVNAVLFGSYMVFDGQMTLSSRLVSVETSEILLTAQVQGEANALSSLIVDLSTRLSEALNASLREDAEADTQPQSLDAMLAYSEGLAALERGNYPLAHDKFEEATTLDPGYQRAQMRVSSLQPVLAALQIEDAASDDSR